MHGRKKTNETRSETEITAIQRKTESLSKTVRDFLDKKQSGDYSSDALELTAKILRGNPDLYSAWNFRKEILISMLPDLSGPFQKHHHRIINDELRDKELKLSEDCIRKNPKSYGSWHHRQWILERLESNPTSELELCKLFLIEDQRNFHCWCYRRLVVQIGGIRSQDEFDFSTDKIYENFSNYSAYHHRSVFIQQIGKCARDIVESEFSMIENAIYTEPDDQSSWWYHQFLLTWMSKEHISESNVAVSSRSNESDGGKWFHGVLDQQMEVMRGLLTVEATSKWAMSSLSMMLEIVLKLLCNITDNADRNWSIPYNVEELDNERRMLLTQLCTVDPYHVKRYMYLLRREYLAPVTLH